MSTRFENAKRLVHRLKGDNYRSGLDVAAEAGSLCAQLGHRALVVRDPFVGGAPLLATVLASLADASVEILDQIDGAPPNAPRGDVARMTEAIDRTNPDVVVSFGGGSTIDSAKAACVLHAVGGPIDNYFGTGLVTKRLQEAGLHLTPHFAIQTAASSGAHLTKYSNITEIKTGQKKLIVDDAIIPERSLFDYGVTLNAPRSLTVDGALDGLSHLLEVLFGAVGKPYYGLVEELAEEGINLILEYTPILLSDPASREGREALGRATDLGGYSIMVGGTNGAHLTSFSLVDILSHGRACGLLNPYYAVFFAPAIQTSLRQVARICVRHGYADTGCADLEGRALGEAVAKALIRFENRIGVPSFLEDVPGFTKNHIERALSAAKDPQLKMKLENMPVPLTADMVEKYMGPVLRAAASGDLAMIRNV